MSKIKATIVTIIVLTLVQNAFTQEKKHLITAGGGISYLTLSDKNMSPMNYAGVPRLATMGLAIETSAYIDDVALFFGRGNLTMRLSSGEADSKAKITLGNINYIHVRRLHSIASENNKFFLGGNFQFIHSFI